MPMSFENTVVKKAVLSNQLVFRSGCYDLRTVVRNLVNLIDFSQQCLVRP